MEINIKEYVNKRKDEIKNLISKLSIKPHLVIVSLNDDEASKAYVRGKLKDGNDVGANVELIKLNENATEHELFSLLDTLNKDDNIHGIIVQMPLPKQINEEKVKEYILPKKDVDGFNCLSKVDPCTPKGIINFLE